MKTYVLIRHDGSQVAIMAENYTPAAEDGALEFWASGHVVASAAPGWSVVVEKDRLKAA